MVEKIKDFIKTWSDLVILAPSAFILFIVGQGVIRLLDPTAATLELGVLSVLNWNIFLLLITGSLSYFLYDLWFGDFFKKGWEKDFTPIQAATISLILWVTTLLVSVFILLRNL